MSTQEITFDVRNEQQPIDFDGSADEVCEGCLVDLEHQGATITAKVLEGAAPNWMGEVTEFPAGDQKKLGNLKVGAKIKFEDRHIFRCAA